MTPAEIVKELDELESRLERLRVKYDQYFIGIEKMMPFVQRKDVDRRFAQLHKEQFRNGGLRFRFQTMVQRFTTYQTYWGRIIRQIEEGTYKRDVIRAQRLGRSLDRQAAAGATPEAQPEAPTDADSPELEELGDDDVSETTMHASRDIEPEALPDFGSPFRAPTPAPLRAPAPTPAPAQPGPAQPVAPAPRPALSPFAARVPRTDTLNPASRPLTRPTPAPAPAPAPKPAPIAEDPQIRALHQRFVEARRATGENTDVQYESIAKQARENMTRLTQKYQGAEVRMDVSIKDGKAVLKPIVTMPKKT